MSDSDSNASKKFSRRMKAVSSASPGSTTDLHSGFVHSEHPAGIDFLSSITSEDANDLLYHVQGELSQEEKWFLQRWKSDLRLDKWGEFLISWARALAAYDTPASFVDPVVYRHKELSFGGRPFPFIFRSGGNYQRRVELMNKQKAYYPKLPLEDYGLHLNPKECLLCQNVLQACDAEIYREIPSNAILNLGSYCLFPNRYPAQPGASLFLPKNHDDETSRAALVPGKNGGPRTCPSQKGKTRNRILTALDLYALMCVSNAFDLVAIRNHVLSGMSIPAHDHFHVFPADLPSAANFKNIIRSCSKFHPKSEVFIPDFLPFSVLVVRNHDLKRLAGIATEILEKMEKDNHVYGTVYYQNHIFISPRLKEAVADTNIALGGGSVLLFEDSTNEDEYFKMVDRFIPLMDQFDWSPFL
jgi:hypothetical protein